MTADHAVGESTARVCSVSEEVLSGFGVLGWFVNAGIRKRIRVRRAAALVVSVGWVLVLSEIGGHFGGRTKSTGEHYIGVVCPLLGICESLLAVAAGQHGAIRNSLWLISRLQLRLVQPR